MESSRGAELERSLLGAALVDPTRVPELREALPLFSRTNRHIAQAMLDLVAAGQPVNVDRVRHALDGKLDNPYAYLADLMRGVAKSSNAQWYREQLLEIRQRQAAALALYGAAEQLRDGDHEAVRQAIAAAEVALAPREPPRTLEPIDLAESLFAPLDPPPWIIPKWLAAGDTVVFGAQAGYGKSWVSLDLAVALATGSHFLGVDLVGEPQPVLVLDAENPTRLVSRRLQLLMRGRDLGIRDALAMPLRVVPQPQIRLDDEAGRDIMRRELDAHPPKWIILDALVRFTRGRDESASSEMSQFFAEVLDPIRSTYQCGIIVLHHMRKPMGQANGAADPLHDLRGSGDIAAWPDVVWAGTRDGQARTLQVAKSRWCVEGHTLGLSLDDDGDTAMLHGEQPDISAEVWVVAHLAARAEAGALRSDLVEAYTEHTGGSALAGQRAVGRALAKLRGRGAVVDQIEGRKKRLWLAASAPKTVDQGHTTDN